MRCCPLAAAAAAASCGPEGRHHVEDRFAGRAGVQHDEDLPPCLDQPQFSPILVIFVAMESIGPHRRALALQGKIR